MLQRCIKKYTNDKKYRNINRIQIIYKKYTNVKNIQM